MIEVSELYKRAVYTQTTARKFKGEVLFELLDNGAYDDVSIITTSDASISRPTQLFDKVRVIPYRYATYEEQYFKLDGSRVIPPGPSDGDAKIGWWGNEISGPDGTFLIPEVLNLSFESVHNSAGLTINFNTLTGEYAKDFTITVLDADGDIIAFERVVNNKETTYVMDEGLDNYMGILITLTRWSHPGRRAKVSSIDFGLMKTFSNTELVNFSITEEVSVTGDYLPSNELRFTVHNKDRIYNILNSEGQYRFLMERQEVVAKLSLMVGPDKYEEIDMGKYFLKVWQSDEGALTSTFTALDIIDTLTDIPYVGDINTNLYDLAEDIMIKAGINNYYIDDVLKSIPTKGFYEVVTSRDALRHIAIASKSMVNQNREGVLEIQSFRTLDVGTSYISYIGTGLYAGDNTFPAVNQGYDMKNITFANMYDEPKIKLDTHVGTVIMVVENRDTGTRDTYTLVDPTVLHGTSITYSNPLITTSEHALDIAKWLLQERSIRALYDIRWRQNPALECGDLVLVQDSYGAKKQSRIMKQVFDYDATLSGRTETRGGV